MAQGYRFARPASLIEAGEPISVEISSHGVSPVSRAVVFLCRPREYGCDESGSPGRD